MLCFLCCWLVQSVEWIVEWPLIKPWRSGDVETLIPVLDVDLYNTILYTMSCPWLVTNDDANDHCSASGGSFWDRPPGCACLFWIQSGRGLDCPTSMPRGGLDLSQQSPNRRKVGLWNSLVGGRRYVTLAKWVTEVGHWPPSSLGNFSVIKETYFCGANCVALLQCELLLRQLH